MRVQGYKERQMSGDISTAGKVVSVTGSGDPTFMNLAREAFCCTIFFMLLTAEHSSLMSLLFQFDVDA